MWKPLLTNLPLLYGLAAAPALAQSITAAPDGTGTIVTIDGQTYHIQGGTEAGANLFHSFQDFGLSSGEIANFLSNPGVVNIFGRVTGGNASIIDGLIQANPNLYLMNPAGIVFGANAQLNVGGDFFATTADQICFTGGCFNAAGVNSYSGLLGGPTHFGFLQAQPGSLVNAGVLNVQKGKSVHLSGGTVVNLGEIAAPGGAVNIAAIPGSRNVRLAAPGNLLSLEVSDTVLTEAISPLDLPDLLATAPSGLEAKMIATPLGNVDIAGSVQAAQVDFYAAGQVTPRDSAQVEGATRVTRFSESGENPNAAVFIDARADHPEQLLYGAAAGTVSQVIGKDEKGISVVSEQLSVISESVGELDSVAIVAEGNQGNFWLGNQWITAGNVADYQAQLQQWGAALTETADILLYSCFTALGATGEALVASLAEMTGADVAASDNVTGSNRFGGDWNLEHQTGAIESGNPFTPATLTGWDGKLATRTVQNLNDTGAGSLRDALTGTGGPGSFWATPVAAGDDINFAVTGTINIGAAIDWTVDNLTLDGPGQNDLILDGGGGDRIFNFQVGANTATIQNITLQNASSTGLGGAIRFLGNDKLTIANTTITGNSSGILGGGIYGQNGMVKIKDSIITNNSATGEGGGVHGRSGITLENSLVSNNTSGGKGGGVSSDGNAIINNSTIINNSSANNGGGISSSGYSRLINATVSGNSTSGEGGGIATGNTVIAQNSTISNNSSVTQGGGIAGGIAILNNSTVSNNQTQVDGGGLSLQENVVAFNSTISGNIANNKGGGFTVGTGETVLFNTVVQDNQAADMQSNDILSQDSDINFFETGDLNFDTSIRFQGSDSELLLSGNNVNVLSDLDLGGVDLRINAGGGVNGLKIDTSVSTAGATGGNITITATNDIQLRNVLTFGTNGNGGNVYIESYQGRINTTTGGSEGLIDTTGRNGSGGNVVVRSRREMTIGKVFAEGIGGAGGQVELDSESLIRIIGSGTSGFGGAPASISTAGSSSGGPITIRHGGGGLIPFIVGDGGLNGSATRLMTGNFSLEQSIFPTREFLNSYIQGAIQILSVDAPQLILPPAGSNPPLLTFYNETPEQLFIKLIADRLDAEVAINKEKGEMLLAIPGEENPIVIPLDDLPSADISYIDEQFEIEYETHFQTEFDEDVEAVSLASIRQMLTTIEAQTGTRPVIIYALSHPGADWLELLLITPQSDDIIRKQVLGAEYELIERQLSHLNRSLRETRDDRHLVAGQQLYDWLIRPIAADLEQYNIDTLVFAMSPGLRTVPLSALHDGQRFLIQDYSLALIPSVSLTDSRYQPLAQATPLAMGIDEFTSFVDAQSLPAVPAELDAIARHYPNAQLYRNEAFRFETLRSQRQQPFEIIHLATHAQFDPTYIQFWAHKVGTPDFRSLGWYNDPAVELLVLSACETAIGDLEVELGFAGLAVGTGVKSAVASLWQVSDRGTLALMDGFYGYLADPQIPIKAEALRQAQLSLLGSETYRHPYYWSGFTMVGSPW
ncbi:MAG: CHAT domain-containing protein [Spirulinaceae cyanobacterium]